MIYYSLLYIPLVFQTENFAYFFIKKKHISLCLIFFFVSFFLFFFIFLSLSFSCFLSTVSFFLSFSLYLCLSIFSAISFYLPFYLLLFWSSLFLSFHHFSCFCLSLSLRCNNMCVHTCVGDLLEGH